MFRIAFSIVLYLSIVAGCSVAPPEPVLIEALDKKISYLADIKPILDKRCVVCHSCYNAPCQLKLSSFEGLDRGASKKAVYNAVRITAQDPSRLFTDAQTTGQWREKDFFSVTDNTATEGSNNSILLHLLNAKRKHPSNTGVYFPESSELSCAANGRQLGSYLKKHPNQGMPFGFPPLQEAEYQLMATWLQRGSPGPNDTEQKKLQTPSAVAQSEINNWETFLNQDDAKHAMTARYLYEHLFLAHLSFHQTAPKEFYELVRSRTPSGEPIEIIATVRPYDDPGVEKLYYRFRKIHSTIVHKTHMVFKLDDNRLQRIRLQFIDPEWLEEPYRVDYKDKISANPFLTYAQIPAKSRYQFLLDNAEYIIRTFIRGPVCKGQIALNVIHDHFWVMFFDPESDLTLREPGFLTEQAQNLSLPTEKGSTAAMRIFSNTYRNHYEKYFLAKQDLYLQHEDNIDLNSIWKGEQSEDAPLLTVYRHFDSASVHKGVLGELPRTLWLIDYPHLERIYYALVAGFDVFGNVTHQTNVRRYMDYLRMEGETNFISFLPANIQLETLKSWYIGDNSFDEVEFEITHIADTIGYTTDDPKRELIERIVEEHILKSTGIKFDEMNYYRTGESPPQMPALFTSDNDIITAFRSLTAPGTAFIKKNTHNDVNVLYLHVRNFNGEDVFISIVINRWHDNVNSLFDESYRLDPAKDTMDFFKGSLGSYPSYFFSIDASELPDFFNLMANYNENDEKIMADFFMLGINRSDENFWQEYDWFQGTFNQDDQLESGLYDLNRYYNEAL